MNGRRFKKALSWKFISTGLALGIGYFLTGSYAIALGIAGLHIPLSIVLYMAHEALWDRIP